MKKTQDEQLLDKIQDADDSDLHTENECLRKDKSLRKENERLRQELKKYQRKHFRGSSTFYISVKDANLNAPTLNGLETLRSTLWLRRAERRISVFGCNGSDNISCCAKNT